MDKTDATARLTERLRAVLIAEFGTEPIELLAAALAYELASMVATVATDQEAALTTLLALAATQVEQVSRFGVGQPHP